MLDRDDVRLVTLTGAGGIGKTRLALEVATRMQRDFAHGARFVSLAAIRDLDLVPSAVAQALDIRESGDRPVAELVLAALRSQHLLLVLDNMEQVVAAAPWLVTVLESCLRLKVMVTSRVRLRLRGERSFSVPPLPVPDVDHGQPVEGLAQIAAVALFTERARAVRPGFALNETNAGTVEEICRHLEGLPLAIELAAARISMLPPAALLARLDNRLRLLTGRMRDMPLRLQTMRNAIEWSYDLLAPQEQLLFRRLAVFSGGFTVEAAETVGAIERPDGAGNGTSEVLSTLVDHSLIQPVSNLPGDGRFEMLEVIREYALERLLERGEDTRTRTAHLEYYLELAVRTEPELYGAEQVRWMARLEEERANLRTAAAWAIEAGAAKAGLRMVTALWRFWWVRGDYAEILATICTLLALPAAAERTVERGRALNAAGGFAMMTSSTKNAEALYQEALSIAHERGDVRGIGLSLLSMALLTFHHHGDGELSIRYLHESLAAYQEIDDRWGQCAALIALGNVNHAKGNLELARDCLERAAALAERDSDWHQAALALNGVGAVARATGRFKQAVSLHREALALYQRIGDRGNIVACLESLGGVFGAAGQPGQAVLLFGAADAYRRSIGTRMLPSELPSYEADQNHARSLLGDTAFAAARAVGESMSLDEALALAFVDDPKSIPVPSSVPNTSSPIAHPLSPRELEVLKLIADGLSNREIADTLFISHRTATSHISNILGKLGLTSRTAAVAYAIRHGLV